MNRNVIVGLVAVLVLGGLGVWYINSSKTSAPTVVDVEEVTPSVAEVASEVKEFVVNGNDFKFDVTEMKVRVGDKVRVTFRNTGGFHDFVLDEFAVKTAQLADGAEETVEFVADVAGTYEYYCSVGKHRQMGMVGKLIVE